MPNAIDVLTADHNRLRQILAKLTDRTAVADDVRSDFMTALEQELKMHAIVEEEILYPEFKDVLRNSENRELYWESLEEHHLIDMLLPEFMTLDAGGDHFLGKAKVLKELVENHASEEEREVFPKMQATLGAEAMHDMGARIVDRKSELEKQWESVTGRTFRNLQAIVEKFAPAAAKEWRGAKGERDRREERH